MKKQHMNQNRTLLMTESYARQFLFPYFFLVVLIFSQSVRRNKKTENTAYKEMSLASYDFDIFEKHTLNKEW